MQQLCNDLLWEQNSLDALVSSLDPTGWATVTHCSNWTIKDQICHLAYFDATARLAATDAEAFGRHAAELFGSLKRMEDFVDLTMAAGRQMPVDELLAWWRTERAQMNAALVALDPKHRLPWYGPTMSALSFATARLMETWAHGQDVYDALKRKRPPSPGLKHIAHLGVTTFGWSFTNRQLAVPQEPVRVELTGPPGDLWCWGEASAADIVRGPAEDFCLVVTQRRHVDDTALEVTGATARRWMLLAHAFAGPPDQGPPPGMFA